MFHISEFTKVFIPFRVQTVKRSGGLAPFRLPRAARISHKLERLFLSIECICPCHFVVTNRVLFLVFRHNELNSAAAYRKQTAIHALPTEDEPEFIQN